MAIKTKIQLRRDTLANWSSINPVLASGEVALVDKNNGTGSKSWVIRIGDGKTEFNSLPETAYALRSDLEGVITDVATISADLSGAIGGDFTIIKSNIASLSADVGELSASVKTANDNADAAKATAGEAKLSADAAVTAAEAAEAKATQAAESATSAQESASAAQSSATAAQESATSAQGSATSAQESASAAQSSATAAQESASAAEASASSASTLAGEAKTLADKAILSAEQALQVSEAGQQTANEAKDIAGEANTTADAAWDLAEELSGYVVGEQLPLINEQIGNINTTLGGLDNRFKVTISDPVTDTEKSLVRYTFSQGGASIGAVEVPHDVFVDKGELSVIDGKTYLLLTLNNDEQTVISVDVESLVDVYTGLSTDTIDVTVDEFKIMASVKENSIDTKHLIDGAVTAAKIGDDAVITDKIKAGAVTTDKIADQTITAAKLSQSDTFIFDCGGAGAAA